MTNLETDCDPHTSSTAQNQEACQRNHSISFSDIILQGCGKSKGHGNSSVELMLLLLPVFTPTPQDQIITTMNSTFNQKLKIPFLESSRLMLGGPRKVKLVEPAPQSLKH